MSDADIGEASSARFSVFYKLDQNNKITDLGGVGFDDALAGQDAAVAKANILGANLFDYIVGHFTRRFLREFLGDARRSGEERRRVYRCDSAWEKIFMEMSATPDTDGGLLLQHRRLSSEPMPIYAPILTASAANAVNARRCSLCNRLKARGSSEWVEPEVLVKRGFSPVVIHTVCEKCRVLTSSPKSSER